MATLPSMKSKMFATIMITPAVTNAPSAERPGGRDVDQHADEREDVRMDPQRDAGADDQLEREQADPADEPGEGHES